MTTVGSGSYSMVCHICNQSIEIFGGDFQNSLELHNLKVHPSAERLNKNQTQPAKKKSISSNGNETVSCPICKDSVEIINNNYGKSLQKHFESHDQVNVKPRSDDQLYTFDGIRNWIDRSENADNRSTSSRDNYRRQKFPGSPLNALPMGLKQHRGFFNDNKDSIFCNICRLAIDSNSVQEHIKTKTHEDNVVLCLKQRFPTHLQNAMEFVSFYGSNLCCNLCRCKIDLSSFNVHETIVNILFHNSEVSHNNRKSNKQIAPQGPSEVNPGTIINSLAGKYPEIKENKNLIKWSVEPQFKCKWCDKSILYCQKDHALAQNIIAHFNTSVHKKSKEASGILNAFKMMKLTGYENHKLVIANGGISCVQCKHKIESDINKVLLHLSSGSQFDENNSVGGINPNTSKTKSAKNQQKVPKNAEKKKLEPNTNVKPLFANSGAAQPLKVNLQAILGPLERQFGKVTCIIQKEEGSVMCLICNCSIPATSQNITDHLTGNSHSKNIESKLEQINADKTKSFRKIEKVQPVDAGSRVNELFYSLPFGLQEDKKYIKDSPIDGYIICALCNQVVNPQYLRDHLLDRKHIIEKQAQCGLLEV